MKKILLLLAISIGFASCGQQTKKANAEADSLAMVIAAKDSIINDAFNSISEIASNINQIAEREKLITTQTSSGTELSKPAKEQIAENIAAISALLEKNRATITSLQASTQKLKDANVQIDALQKLVVQLQNQLKEKDAQLAEITEQVKALKIEVATLGQAVSSLQGDKTALEGTVAQQDAALHTVYYIVGVEKELMKSEIIDKKGFIGRTRVLGEKGDMTGFTKADDRTVDRISIGQKRVRVVSAHPQTSYMLVEGASGVTDALVITDRDAFWKNSKVLVVSYR